MELSTEIARDKVLIIGATSAIAEAVAILFASKKYHLYLLARDEAKLAIIKKKLLYHGAETVQTYSFQANNLQELAKTLNGIFQTTKIDIALIAHGILLDQKLTQKNWNLLQETMQTNSLSVLFILEFLAEKMEQAKKGTIAVFTSLAVENSTQENYIYAASKAMVASFLKGLGDRLRKAKVKVMDIRFALVQTPMTVAFQKKLSTTPQNIAPAIFRAITQSKQNVVYIPSYWRIVMFIIRNLPNNIFLVLYRFIAFWNLRKKS